MTFQLLDLFSGIGGFSLGLERSGAFRTVAFCEIDPYCRRVLSRHWPEVPCFEDVRTLDAAALSRAGVAPDAICGGFPCTDISVAGKGAGLEGPQSSLWREYRRLIGELRPKFVVVENVAALLGRGLADVLGDLAALGYDAEWHCIPAAYLGAPHRRDRVWIVAYPARDVRAEPEARRAVWQRAEAGGQQIDVADAGGAGLSLSERPALCGARWRDEGRAIAERGWWLVEPDVGGMAHGTTTRLDGGLNETPVENTESSAARSLIGGALLRELQRQREITTSSPGLHRADKYQDTLPEMPCEGGPSFGVSASQTTEIVQDMRRGVHVVSQQEALNVQPGMPFGAWPHERDEAMGIWQIEPDTPRVANRVANRVDRLRALGNAVVPQIPELIGRAIAEALA